MEHSHKWSIKKFGHFLYKHSKNENVLTFVQSNSFPSDEKMKFFLRCYPIGIDKRGEDHVAISLHFHNDKEDEDVVAISYQLGIIDRDNVAHNLIVKSNKIISVDHELKHAEFIKQTDLFNPFKGYLPDEKLTIFCKIKILRETDTEILTNGIETDTNENLIPSESESNAEVEFTRLKHEWSIKNFESALNLAQQNDISLSKDLDDHEHNKLFLRLWPSGRGSENHNYISIYLYPLICFQNEKEKENYNPKSAQYQLSLINLNAEKFHTKLFKEPIGSGIGEFGAQKYVNLKELKHNDLLAQNILTIHCEVDLIGNENPLIIPLRRIKKRLNLSEISNSEMIEPTPVNVSVAHSTNVLINVQADNQVGDITSRIT